MDLDIVNAYLGLLCIAMISFILVATIISYKKTKSIKYFICLLIVQLFLLITSSIMSFIKANGDKSSFQSLNNLVYISYLFGYMLVFLFGEYLFTYINEKKKINQGYYIILAILTIFSVGFIALSLSNRKLNYFIYDNDFKFSEYYYIYSLFEGLILFAVVGTSLVYFKYLTKKEKITFLVFETFPLTSIIFDILFPKIMFSSIIPSFGLLLIYINIYIDSYKSKEQELANHKQMILLSQIRPHFIFNTLSIIKALYLEDPKEGERILDSFSTYLRGNINSLSNDNLISFKKELEHTKCYLDIEKTRFMDRLNVVFDIKDDDFLIPSLIIQPIAENAVRHGVSKKANGGTVKISSWLDDKNHVIEVYDDGVGFDVSQGFSSEHVGIQNIKERIESYVKGKVAIESKIDCYTRVTISIPRR